MSAAPLLLTMKFRMSPYAYSVPAPRMVCPQCQGLGAVGSPYFARCDSCNGHGKVTLAKVSA